MVACHLLKWVDYQFDTEGREIELRYFRDVDKREVDFVLVEHKKPILAVECKLNESTISPSLKYFKEKFPAVRAVQVAYKDTPSKIHPNGIELKSARTFLNELI